MAVVLALVLAAGLVALVAWYAVQALRDRWRGHRDAGAADGSPVLAVASWGGVMLECGPNDVVLCLLPTLASDALTALRTAPPRQYNIAALVVSNQGEAGWLWTSEVRRHLRIPSADVYVTEPAAPLDRAPGMPAGDRSGRAMPKALNKGTLSLRWDPAAGLLIATWTGTRVRAAVGTGVSLGALPAGTTAVIGSVRAAPAARPQSGLQSAFLVVDCPPGTDGEALEQLTREGVHVVRVTSATPP